MCQSTFWTAEEPEEQAFHIRIERRDQTSWHEESHGSNSDPMDVDESEEAPVIPERPAHFELGHPREPPIRFYDRNRPYYEFTNFAAFSVRYNGRRYPTAEHLFQAHKFLDTDPHLAEHIRKLPTPRAALQEASRLRRLQRSDWFDVNLGFMDIILEAKFTQHASLRHMLLSTGDRELIEDSPVDSFWGTGADGQGRNELGKSLMRLREKLHRQQDTGNTGQYIHR